MTHATAPRSSGEAADAAAVGVTLVTGFLGSGKTTLLNHLLAEARGRRIAVIVNEFGQLNIDAELIADVSGSVVRLSNGCICCATKGDLLRSLQELLSGADPIDDVVVEASGLADPGPIMEGLLRFRFPRELHLGGVVTVLDAARYDENLDHAEAAYHQLVYGDVLLLNKVDLVDGDTAGLIERAVRRLNADAPVVRCVECRVPAELVLAAPRHPDRVEPGPAATGHDHEHDFDTVSATVDGPLARERFEAWARELPDRVLRAKGFVRFAGEDAACVFQRVGQRQAVVPAASNPLPSGTGAMVVLIGRGLDGERLAGGLRGCVEGRS